MAEIKPKLHRYLYGYKGYLVKQGKVFRQWSSRYFVLEKRKIKYYENDTLQTLLGEMVIDSNAHLYDISEEVDSMKNLFYVVGKSPSGVEESLFLSAPSEKEKQDWIEAITDAVHDGFKQIFQPDLWASDFYPHIDVGIFYRKSGVAAENGNIIRPSNTDYAPDVVFKGVKSEDRYSFIMLDIDPISSIENPSNKFFLHWGVINISGLEIKTGEELAPYVPPAPVYNSGLHRFFFILFKQRTFISSIVLNEITELFHKRDGFPFMKWVRLMDFADPAGINGFYAGWEDYCDDLHARLNYIPPETFRSPNQESAIKKELTRKRIEQAMADLYRDLTLKDVFVGCDQPIPAPNQVPISLQISFPSLTEIVKDGQIISVNSALEVPTIVYEDYAAEDFYYTLILTDPDFPSRVNPSLRELVHWVVVNIPSNRISEGKIILDYLPPAPPFSSGLHRYVFCLYKQLKKLEEPEIVSAAIFFQERKGIHSYEWIKSQSSQYSTNPIGLEAFITEWDECVDGLHEQMNWMPPQPYRSRKQSIKLNSPTEDLEDIETVREARVAELEYELKTTVLQTIAQLHSAPVPSVSPKPEPIKSAPLLSTSMPQNIPVAVKEEVRSVTAVSKSGERSELPPLPPPPLRSSTPQPKENVQVTVKAVTSTVTTTVKSSALVPDDEPVQLRDSAPSPVPPTQTLKPQFSIGIVPEQWTDRQHLEKAPLLRQNGLNERAFGDREPSASPNLASVTKSSDDIIPSSTHSSVSLRGLAILAANESNNKPPEKSLDISPVPVNSTASPVKTFTITNADDLDLLLAPSPPGAKQEVENYDDDDEIENSSAHSKVSSSNASAANKSKPVLEGPDHRSNPQSLFNRIGLFKAQSQYMPNSRDSENAATSKPKKIAASSSMYFKSPSEDPNKAPKKLTTSSSMYFKAFDNTKLTDFKTPEDSADALVKCSAFDISSSTVFEGEIMKKKFSTDFMFKDSIIWIDSVSKSLHWGKSVTERRNPQFSKYIFLNRVHGIDQAGIAKPLGEMKGIFKSVDTNGTTVIVHLESEEFLELKFSVEGTPPTTKRISDWVKVIRALSG